MKRMMSNMINQNNRKENRERKRLPVLFALWMMAILLIIYGAMAFATAETPDLATPTDLSEELDEEKFGTTPAGKTTVTETETSYLNDELEKGNDNTKNAIQKAIDAAMTSIDGNTASMSVEVDSGEYY